MKINRTEFMKALETCLPATDTQNDVFFISKDRVQCATALMHIIHWFDFPEPFAATVKASDFYQLIKKFTAEELDVSVDETHVHLKSGKSKAKLALLSAKMAGNWPHATLEPVELPSNFFEVVDACFIPSNKSVMSGIYFSETEVVSSDRVKLNYATLDASMPTFWISDPAIKIIMKHPYLDSYSYKNNTLYLKGEGIELAFKLLNHEQYPKKVFDKFRDVVMGCTDNAIELPDELLDAVKRAIPMVEKGSDGQFVSLTFASGSIIVQSEKGTGDYEEELETESDFEFEPVLVDYRHLEYGIKGRSNAWIIDGEPRILVIGSDVSRCALIAAN